MQGAGQRGPPSLTHQMAPPTSPTSHPTTRIVTLLVYYVLRFYLQITGRKDSKVKEDRMAREVVGGGGMRRLYSTSNNVIYIWSPSNFLLFFLPRGVCVLFSKSLSLFSLLTACPWMIILYQIICLKMRPEWLAHRASGNL